MKVLFYMGRNKTTQSGLSWKIWKIERKGRRVLTYWGPARVVGRKVIPIGKLQSNKARTPPFASARAAAAYAQARVRRKLAKGYEIQPRKRR